MLTKPQLAYRRRKLATRIGLLIVWLYGASFALAELPGGWWTFPTVFVAVAGMFGLAIWSLRAILECKS